jgi:L-lactate dehydrogenase complex protein LldF
VTSFQEGARIGLRDAQLRSNLGHATRTIREKRSRVVAELPDWEALRAAGAAAKDAVLRNLEGYLLQLEDRVQERGGAVPWARDAA